MPLDAPQNVIDWAKAADSELWPVLLAIAKYESVYNPNAQGDCKMYKGGPLVPCATPGSTPYSFGLLQFYTDGGLGDGYSPSTLLDGPTNLRLGAQYIRGEIAGGKSLYDAIWPWSTRPQAWAQYQQWLSDGSVPGGGSTPPDTQPGGGSTPPDTQQPAPTLSTIAGQSVLPVVLGALGVFVLLDLLTD